MESLLWSVSEMPARQGLFSPHAVKTLGYLILKGVIGHTAERTDLRLPKQTGKVERDAGNSAKGCKQSKKCASLS